MTTREKPEAAPLVQRVHSMEDVAALSKTSRSRVADAIKDGSLRSFKVGRLRRCTDAQVNEWINKLVKEGSGDPEQAAA